MTLEQLVKRVNELAAHDRRKGQGNVRILHKQNGGFPVTNTEVIVAELGYHAIVTEFYHEEKCDA